MSKRIIFIAVCASLALLTTACQNAPRFKKGQGKFNQWGSYEGKGFEPSPGTVTAIDTAANTVTISNGKEVRTFPVTANTRIIHEDQDIPLAQLPVNQAVKFRVADSGRQLVSVWYGTRTFAFAHPNSQGAHKRGSGGSPANSL
jgi:hypothetical protein